MKASAGLAAAVILAFIGTAVAAYSYSQLQQVVVLFNENSIQIDGQSYSTWQANLGDPGNYFIIFSPKIVGGVSSVGDGVDFYLVNDTNWYYWASAGMGQRSALATLHLNSTVLSSQSAQGQFSFTPPTLDSYIVVLVNDEYPHANSATVNVNITFQYTSLFSFCGFIFGLIILGLATIILTLTILRKAKTSPAPQGIKKDEKKRGTCLSRT